MTFLEKYFKSLRYVQISPQRLTVRNPFNGMTISEEPRIALLDGPKARILGLGPEASVALGVPNARIFNPFQHPPVNNTDYIAAGLLVKEYVNRLATTVFYFKPAPVIVMHLNGKREAEVTQVELGMFREMALSIGASRAVMYLGPDLSDAQLLAGDFTPASI